jgi:fibronectin-binding autotransporter adhesin
MTTVVLTGTYTSGYPLKPSITVLSITTKGYVEGNGVYSVSSNAYTIVNDGRVNDATGGSGAVFLGAGGIVTNGSNSDQSALIESGAASGVDIQNVAAPVNNYGTIISSVINPGAKYGGVYIAGGGKVTNGSLLDTAARIEGQVGVTNFQTSGTATIANFGTIQGVEQGVLVNKVSANITNGAATQAGALIEGGLDAVSGVESVTVKNFGTLIGLTGIGVYALGGGAITNGGPGDTTALIEGYTGVKAPLEGGPATTVVNFGSIVGAGAFGEAGIYLGGGGSVTNGSANDHSALVSGYGGVIAHSAATVVNFGSIEATGASSAAGAYGVALYAGGSMTNGSVNDQTALISGYGGFLSEGAGSSTNFGIIRATGGLGAYGAAFLNVGASFTNGSVNDHAAMVEGYAGALLVSGDTLTNFGVIEGVGGKAVYMLSSSDTLVVEAGSSFIGSVNGGDGTLDLASGPGTISGLFAGGDVTVSGSMATTTFDDFGALEIGPGASFTLTGTAVVAAGQSLIDDGTLTVTGALTSAGTLGGTGVADFTAGTDSLTGGTLSVADVNVTGATVTLSGKIAVPSVVTVSGKLLVANGTSLTGAGAIVLTDSASNEVTGATATSLLTNDMRIEGEGQLGDGAMELTNAASGSIYSLGAGSLTLNTGTSTILNAGDIVSEGTGGLTIASPLTNTGELIAYSSPLTVSGAVTGAGTAELENAGTLILKGAFNENVTFASGSTGALELGDSKGYTTGSITGFSKTGANALDLLDIPFVSGTTTATYSGTTTSGVLTVKDGANVATIHLTGNYTTSTFTVSAGPGGAGTKVVDPGKASTPPHGAAPLSPHPFIAAMAGFGATRAGSPTASGETWRGPPPILAMPRGQIA